MAEDAAGRWLDLGEAARLTGTSPDALRKRLRRGSLPWPTRRDNHGRWQVRVPDASGHGAPDVRADAAGHRPAVSSYGAPPAPAPALVAELATLRERVAGLERERDTLRASWERERTELRAELERSRALAEAERQRVDALIEALANTRRQPWPGLRAWWRRWRRSWATRPGAIP